MHRPVARRLLALLALLALAASACGSDEGPGAESGSDAGESTSPALTGDPVLVGFVNTGEGPLASPNAEAGADAAVRYVNGELGGIGGRPLQLVECSTDGSPESSIDCTNTFIERGVVAVVEGLDVGSDAKIPLLDHAGIPLVGHITLGSQMQVNPNAFLFSPSVPIAGAVGINTLADLDVGTLAVIAPDLPSIHSFIETGLTPAAAAKGLEVQLVTYNPAAPDFAALVAAAEAGGADAVWGFANEAGCTALVSATHATRFEGPVLVGTCTEYIAALGADAANAYTIGSLWYAPAVGDAPANKAMEVEAYVAAMEAAGHQDATNTSSAQGTFQAVVDLSRIVADIDGDISPESVKQAMETLKDFDTFTGQTLSCDRQSRWSGDAGCGTAAIMYVVTDDGSIRPVDDGFVDATGHLQI